MVFKKQENIKMIKEFLDMVENHKVELRRYRTPTLVWAVQEGTVYYSFWEKDMLDKFGLENVDGWDFEEDMLFCPDWVVDEDDDLDDDEDEDDDLGSYFSFKDED
ncbi:MAG: hypothetical protein U1C33_04905 [Candidatus Cloacimonadaceae bacterium]|nr:hypothetical protein [Candidatus Cloacimonadaceae bacterium]